MTESSDILKQIFDRCVNVISLLPSPIFTFPLRSTLILAPATLACRMSFELGSGICVISPFFAQTDTLGQLFQSYVNGVSHMSDSTLYTLLRLAVMLILTTIVCGRTHANLRQEIEHGTLIPLQWILAFAVSFLVLSLPIPRLTFFGPSRAFVFTVALMAISILPWRLAKLLLPTAGHQKVLGVVIYVLIGMILVLNFINS